MIIVTGGAGFIGSNLVRGLNDAGEDDILIVDNLGNAAKHLNLNGLKFSDYADKEDFLPRLGAFKKAAAIFHQGACSSTTETDARYMMKNNYEYSKDLLNFALKNRIDFLYASSASVYGNGGRGFSEKRECEYPLNVYAFSKYAFDNYVRRVLGNGKVKSQVLGLRYFNVYGCQENHKGPMASVAFHFFNQIRDNGNIRLFEGSREFRRDFVFVRDTVDVNLHFYETKKSGIFNCGTGKERSFYDIAVIFQKLEPAAEIEFIPFPDHLKGKYQAFTRADLSGLRSAGYTKEFISLEEGLGLYHRCLNSSGGYFIE